MHPDLPLLASYGIESDVKLWQFRSPEEETEEAEPAKPAPQTSSAPTAAVVVKQPRQPYWFADREHCRMQHLGHILESSLEKVGSACS